MVRLPQGAVPGAKGGQLSASEASTATVLNERSARLLNTVWEPMR